MKLTRRSLFASLAAAVCGPAAAKLLPAVTPVPKKYGLTETVPYSVNIQTGPSYQLARDFERMRLFQLNCMLDTFRLAPRATRIGQTVTIRKPMRFRPAA